jgi:hypothetical protein
VLQAAGVHAAIGERIAGRVAQHVDMHREWQLRRFAISRRLSFSFSTPRQIRTQLSDAKAMPRENEARTGYADLIRRPKAPSMYWMR